MSEQVNLRPTLRQKANGILGQLPSSEREALLVKCWMSHDARWFMAVAMDCGISTANRLNQLAAHEIGKVEAQRIARALRWPPVTSADEYLIAQEVFIGFLGPDLLDYQVIKVNDNVYRVKVQRCFANENVVRAGVADRYECGIFARVTGWLEGLGMEYEMTPSLGVCLKVEGTECIHTFTFRAESQL